LTFDVNGDGDEPVVSFTSPSNDHVNVNERLRKNAFSPPRSGIHGIEDLR